MNILRKSPELPPDPSRRYDEVVKVWAPGVLANWQPTAQGCRCSCDKGVHLIVEWLEAGIVRFRYALNGAFERDFSYAVDPDFSPEPPAVIPEAVADGLWLRTPELSVFVEKIGLKISIYDAAGICLHKDRSGFAAEVGILGGNQCVSLEKAAPAGEAYYGLGDKACAYDMRGKTFHQWCEDAFGFGENTDQLYRAVPFYYALREGNAYGIFLENTHRTRFELGISPAKARGKERASDFTRWTAEGGEMRYCFIHGPNLMDVARRYHALTGRPQMPPLWALGYHQCRWSYFPESRVLEIARGFRELDIPCDGIWLDIDYMDGYRCFTWHPKRFPDPAGLLAQLSEMGFKTVVMIDPGIKVERGYGIYEDGHARGHFCRRSDGTEFQGPVWPGDCAFPDFTHPAARDWWAGLYGPFLEKSGVHGVWNDMNEPAVFEVNHKTFPDNVLHDFDGAPCDHRRAHNVYGLLMSKATHDGLLRARPESRPFVLSRATSSGGQRYAALWTGDNVASWAHLRLALRQCVHLSISGFSFCGTDIGGFVDRPDGELYVRWLQLAVFHPLMRTHSMGDHMSGNTAVDEAALKIAARNSAMDQEPWAFGEVYTAAAREAIGLRYRLLAYLYTAFWCHVQDGTPILRPTGFDENEALQEGSFYFGNDIWASPVAQKRQRSKTVSLPKNGLWYALEQDGPPILGGEKVKITTPLGYVPLFVRGGTVLPLWPVRAHTGQPVETLTLQVYWAEGTGQSVMYEDEGEGLGYHTGTFRASRFELTCGGETGLTLSRSIEGTYAPGYQRVVLSVIGAPEFVGEAEADGAAVFMEKKNSTAQFVLARDFRFFVWKKVER